MELFDCKIFYIMSAIVFFAMACFMFNTKQLVARFRNTLPEDLIPYRYLSARRILGLAYIFIGAVTLTHIYLHTSEDLMCLYPGEILLIGSAQMILTISALLSLYNSTIIRRSTIACGIVIFMSPALIESLSASFSISDNIVKYVLFSLFILQIILSAAAFMTGRRHYVRIMTARLGGEEAANYRKCGSAVLFILMLILAIWALVPLFIPTKGCAGAFISAYTIYNVALGIYFHSQKEDSSVVQEITTDHVLTPPCINLS